MPYDREHGVLVWGGSLPGGETWSNSLRMAETEQVVGANDTAGWAMQEWLDHFTAVIQAHHANTNSFISDRCKLNYVKFNRVDINGRYVDNTTYMNVFANVSGGRSGNVHPNQICLAVTLTTAVARGPANKGRIFSPMPAIAIELDGTISVGAAQDAALQFKTFFEALSDVPGVDLPESPGVVVMSKVGTGVRTRRVSGVRVGRVLDTQRRRRRALAENYQLQTVDQGTF